MKKTTLAIISTAILLLGCMATASANEAIQAQLQDYRTAMMEFGQRLRNELQAAMKEGGPTAAVEVCHSRAPEIAATISAETGLNLSRTSLKPRATAPDDWEAATLRQFEQQKAAGIPVAELEYHEVVDVDGTPTLRYMKAIGTDAICLTCHGTNVDSTLKAQIQRLYPEDQAMGFTVGDIRGAFTISAPAP